VSLVQVTCSLYQYVEYAWSTMRQPRFMWSNVDSDSLSVIQIHMIVICIFGLMMLALYKSCDITFFRELKTDAKTMMLERH